MRLWRPSAGPGDGNQRHIAAQRARELVPSGLVSRSDLDKCEAQERSAPSRPADQANVEAADQPGLRPVTARFPAARASSRNGRRAGRPSTATLLTTVEQLDPIYVNFDQPAVEVERLAASKAPAISPSSNHTKRVDLTLPDGTVYDDRACSISQTLRLTQHRRRRLARIDT